MEPLDPTVLTRRSADVLASGVTEKMLRGVEWEHSKHGLVRPAHIGLDDLSARLSDAAALSGGVRAIGGWASLCAQGNRWFDGLDHRGRPVPIMIHCAPATQIRPREGIVPCRCHLHDGESVRLGHLVVTTLARAAYDQMRIAPNLREAVVALDMATTTTSEVPHTTIDAVTRVIESHRKTRGIVQAKRALTLGSSRSASPWETRTRLIAELDGGIVGLKVNRPVFDLFGNLLGIVDLLDEQTGLVIESDGAGHRESERHTDDNHREELFERARMQVCRVTSLDHRDRFATAARMVAARRDAARETERLWTTQRPAWWSEWKYASRWE
jgi:very-short-patch-repair endonuclease